MIDTNNYYPQRDGRIERLDAAEATSAGLLQEHLPGSKVVKAFNHIYSGAHHRPRPPPPAPPAAARCRSSATTPTPARPRRRFIDELGFDVVDGGPLVRELAHRAAAQPGYGAEDDKAQLTAAPRRGEAGRPARLRLTRATDAQCVRDDPG